jgi:hypothetical protein
MVGIQVVRGSDFKKAAEAADEGDQKAKDFVLAFHYWVKAVEAGNDEPCCFSCGVIVRHSDDPDGGNFGGLGYAKLKDKNGNVEGYACPFCRTCERKGWKRLGHEFADQMVKELGLEGVQRVH